MDRSTPRKGEELGPLLERPGGIKGCPVAPKIKFKKGGLYGSAEVRPEI
jgi:hypothetical protein